MDEVGFDICLYEVFYLIAILSHRLMNPSIFLMAFSTSLEGQVVQSVSVFATSSFQTHSLISTVYVVQGVVNGNFLPSTLFSL